jgi:hypothetical protein
MFRVIMRGSQYFVIRDDNITRAGPYGDLMPAELAAAWLNLKAARAAVTR